MSVPRPPGFCKRNLDTENSAKENGKTVAIHLKKITGICIRSLLPSPDFPFHFSNNGRFTPATYPLRYWFGIASVLVRYWFGIGSVIFRRYGTKGEGRNTSERKSA